MGARRILTLEIDEVRFSQWGVDHLRETETDLIGWLNGEAKLSPHILEVCGIRVITDEKRRTHIVRDWASLAVGEEMLVGDAADVPPDEFRRLQKQASAGSNMASKRHAPKKFASETRGGQVVVRRVA